MWSRPVSPRHELASSLLVYLYSIGFTKLTYYTLTNLRRPIDRSESGTIELQQVAASAEDQTRPSTIELTHGVESSSSETATGSTRAGLPRRAAAAKTTDGAPNRAVAACAERTQTPAAASAREVFTVS